MLNQNSKVSINDRNSTSFFWLPSMLASPVVSLSTSLASPSYNLVQHGAGRGQGGIGVASLLAFGVIQHPVFNLQQVLLIDIGEVGVESDDFALGFGSDESHCKQVKEHIQRGGPDGVRSD